MTPLFRPAAIWTALVLLLTAGLAPDLHAQRKPRLPRWKVDPYTKNDPRWLERFGYVSYGPFDFGQRGRSSVTNEQVEQVLLEEDEDLRVRWVETAHFRICSTLSAWAVPMDPKIKGKLRAELTRLKERTGSSKVNPKTRRLDEWLRVHLFAQRLEEHYARMQGLLNVTDESFPADEEARKTWNGPYTGEGPFLGQKNKYLFLLFENRTHFDEYLQRFTGRRTVGGQQWNFMVADSLMYACAADNPAEDGRLRDDTALHGHVVFSATHLLLCGYLHYNYDLPVWIREGLAHKFEREISPKFNSYTRGEGTAVISPSQWRYEQMARKLAATDGFTPMSEAMRWRDFGEMEFDDHVAMWSRWDYLLTLGDDKFAKFLRASKGQIDPTTGMLAGDILDGCRDAMREHYKMTPLTLDERWKAWALETYSAK